MMSLPIAIQILFVNVVVQWVFTLRRHPRLLRAAEVVNLVAFSLGAFYFLGGVAAIGWSPSTLVDNNELSALLGGIALVYFALFQIGEIFGVDSGDLGVTERPLVRALFLFLGTLSVSTRHLAVLLVTLPPVLMLAFFAPRMQKTDLPRSRLSAVWSLGIVLFLCIGFSAALFLNAGVGLKLDAGFLSGMTVAADLRGPLYMYLVAQIFLLVAPLCPLDLESVEDAKDWRGFGFFRIGASFLALLQLLGVIGAFRFFSKQSGDIPAQDMDVVQITVATAVAVFYGWNLLKLFAGRRISAVILSWSAQPIFITALAALHMTPEMFQRR